MHSPFLNSRAMAMTLALQEMDDEVRAAPRRARRRGRRPREARADGRLG